MMHSPIHLLMAIAAVTTAKTIVINVGQSGLTFSPDTSTASVGDILEFHFFSSFHTAVQGDFSTPCQMGSLVASGFDSGPISSSSVFQVAVQDTNPMWFYCSTPSHCQSGMVGVVNPPSSGNSLATYRANAAGTSSSQSAGKVQGGVVVPAGGSGSSSSPSPSPSPTTSVSSAASSAAPTTTSAAAPSSVSPSNSASSVLGSATSIIPASTSANPSSSPNLSSVPGSTTLAAASSSLISGSTSNATSVSGSSTSSAKITPTLVSTSRGGSLKEMIGKTILLSSVLGLGVVIAFMA